MALDANNLTQRIKAVATADPKKTGFLGALVIVLAVLAAQTIPSRAPSPQIAGASTVVASPKTDLAKADAPTTAPSSLRAWLETPITPVGRNLFAVKLEYFPADATRGVRNIHAKSADGFWSELEKSLSLQADQRDKREAQIANYMAQASRLRPQSIMMGSEPKAMINGSLVGEGDVVASGAGDTRIEFRVLKIEARRVIVEREGMRLEIPMK